MHGGRDYRRCETRLCRQRASVVARIGIHGTGTQGGRSRKLAQQICKCIWEGVQSTFRLGLLGCHSLGEPARAQLAKDMTQCQRETSASENRAQAI